jgi:hypothetical protein
LIAPLVSGLRLELRIVSFVIEGASGEQQRERLLFWTCPGVDASGRET